MNTQLGPSAHVDSFARNNLPPPDQWPDFLLEGFDYPERINVGVELTDRMVEKGFGDHTALIGNGRRRTYKELSDWTNRLAHALVENYGVRHGNRVLIRSANNPAMVACWLAATKAGAVVVNTMPMLRAGELHQIVDKAEIGLALCDTRLMDELVACAKDSRFLRQVVGFDGTANHDAELDRIALNKPVRFEAVATGRDDVALLAFTSGTTGIPKATMHFHRDLLIVADGYAKEVLGVTPDDVFVGSPPLAFTFGLGGLAIFPLRFGAAATLLENASPANMIEIIETYRATISFTAPTAYRAMLAAKDDGADLSSLRLAVSAGETLPAPVFTDWMEKTGKPILDGIGATEMLHIFISNHLDDLAPGSTGKPIRGYEAHIVDDDMNEVPRGTVGRLAVRGPTGCRYRRRAPAQVRARRLESDGRLLRPGRGRPFPFHRPFGRHDRLGRLQHRGSRGGGRAADTCPRARMRRDRRARSRARPDRPGACRAGRRHRRRHRDSQAPAGPRQGDDRALQVSALGEVHGRPAEDPDGQDPTLPVAGSGPTRGPTMTSHTILQPAGWARPKGYANGVAAEGKLVFVAGQIGWNRHNHFECADLVGQVRQALQNVVDVLAEADARPDHIVSMTWYLTDRKDYLGNVESIGKVYRDVIGRHYPAMAVVEVTALVEDEAKVEIQAMAVVPR
jgi:2-aminobenzoate-CoA ligase